jgi:hypothetical protein
MVPWDRMSNCFVCLVVPCLAGVVIGGLFLSSGSIDLTPRLKTMDAAKDFQSIAGGCTISATSYDRYSYSWTSSSNIQSSAIYACADRYVHTFTNNADGSQHTSGEEDFLLSRTDTCEDANIPTGAQFASAFTVGSTVPCWRAVDPSTVTRNERTVDPRYASHEGLNYCWRCWPKIGYTCGGTQCITLVDPAKQVQYYASTPNLILPRNIAIVVGSAVGLVLTCACSYFAHWMANREDDSSSSEDPPQTKGGDA